MKLNKLWTVTAALAALAVLCAGCGDRGDTGSSAGSSEGPAVSAEESVAEAEPTLDEILDGIAAAYGDDYLADGEIPPEVLEAEFGLTADLYTEAQGRMPMISVNNDRIVVAKAAEGKADALEAALEDARKRKIEDAAQYPMNIAKTNAAKVVRRGDYVAFLLAGALPEGEPDPTGEDAARHAEEQVQKAVDAFNSAFEQQ